MRKVHDTHEQRNDRVFQLKRPLVQRYKPTDSLRTEIIWLQYYFRYNKVIHCLLMVIGNKSYSEIILIELDHLHE